MRIFCIIFCVTFFAVTCYGAEKEANFIELDIPKDDCSAAFYPVTACVRDGSRSVYIQFLECQPKSAHVTRAYFNWFRLVTRDGEVVHNNDESLPAKWKELVIPSYFKRSGYITVYYRKALGEKETTMQIKIPNCTHLKTVE